MHVFHTNYTVLFKASFNALMFSTIKLNFKAHFTLITMKTIISPTNPTQITFLTMKWLFLQIIIIIKNIAKRTIVPSKYNSTFLTLFLRLLNLLTIGTLNFFHIFSSHLMHLIYIFFLFVFNPIMALFT